MYKNVEPYSNERQQNLETKYWNNHILYYNYYALIAVNPNNIFKDFNKKYILIGANIHRSFDYLILHDNNKCTFHVRLSRFNLPFNDFDELLSVKK